MNKWTFKSVAAAALGVIALAGQAKAAISYSYVTDSPTNSIQVAPGSTTPVRLYLLETLTGGSTSLITADGGLLGGAMKITRDAAAPAGASSLGTFQYNTVDFGGPSDDPNPVPPTAPGSGVQTPTLVSFRQTGPLVGAQPQLGNAGGNAANAKAGAVFLGTLNIVAGTVGTTTTFNLLPIGGSAAGSGDTITSTNSYDLDVSQGTAGALSYTGTFANPTALSVSVVPEPTFAGIAMVVGAAGSMIRRRRQQA